MNEGAPHVTVVMPAYNEADILETSVKEVVTGLRERGESFEVLIVENGNARRGRHVYSFIRIDLANAERPSDTPVDRRTRVVASGRSSLVISGLPRHIIARPVQGESHGRRRGVSAGHPGRPA